MGLWVRFRKRTEAVSRRNATHFLFDIIPKAEMATYTLGGPAITAVRRNGYAVQGVIVSIDPDYFGLYVDVDQSVVYLSPQAKRLASVAYSQVANYVWNTSTVLDTLQNLFAADPETRPKGLSKLPRYEKHKISSEHHTHLRPAEVVAASEDAGGSRTHIIMQMAERLFHSGIVHEATASTFLTYALTAEKQFVRFLLDSTILWQGAKGPDALVTRLKEVSGQIKSINTSSYEPLVELFELVVLVNRGVGLVDWQKERANRTRPDVVEVDSKEVYAKCRQLFGEARAGYKYPKMEIDDYLDRRWEWVPGGSVHSQYDEDQQYIIKGQHTRNKFVTLNLMPKPAIRRFLGSRPEIRAWPSTKYEWGKQRAIYGTDLRSTVLTNFAMFRCEDVLATKFPVGSQAEASKVHKRVDMMLDHADSFCFDYDDFNSQHSIQSMYAVLLAFRDEFKADMGSDQYQAMDWVCQSVRSMYVYETDAERWYQLKGTLLSGWRLTTFMNTVLNWVYMELAGVFELDDVSDSVHNGDDVMIALTKPSTAIKIMTKMHAINARAQSAKCNLFTVAEFLRVEHGAIGADGLGAQYLSRSCATLVHSRIESREPVSLTRLLEADKDRLADLSARTNEVSAVEALSHQLELRAAKIFNTDLTVIASVKRAHRVCGGVNDSRWASVDTQIVKEVGSTQTPTEIDDPSSWPGVFDYATRLERMFSGTIPFRAILGAIVQGSRTTIAMSREEKVRAAPNLKPDRSEWERAMYKTYKGVNTSYYASMARFMSIPPAANNEHGAARQYISAVNASEDKIRAMQILA